ncbi:MAG TPA: restriction endonuclease [candidate division Zixibacteria bacterium]|nr:restriction endonuclease [candidate division Zixibacteria bacterium]
MKYTIEMYHKGLNEHKLVSAPNRAMLNNKVNLQAQKWADKWKVVDSKRQAAAAREASLEEANSRTVDAAESLRQIDNLLIHTLSVDDRVDWESLKIRDQYPEQPPAKPTKKSEKESPPRPNRESAEYTPVFTFLEKLLKRKKQMRIQEFENKFAAAVSEWETQSSAVEEYNNQLDRDFEDELKHWEEDVAEWEKRKSAFLQEQADFNAEVDQMKEKYLERNADSITEYCEMVLNNSEYPDSFPKNFELEYSPESKILILEYEFPGIECLPRVKEVKYIASRKELKESYISESQMNRMFDDAMYKVTLRTIHELFEADVADAVDAISFNGWVKAVNRATGKEETNCILSIQVKKGEFTEIDLSNVDSKACFKNLKGVASSKLSSLTPVQPILQISRTDKRFVEAYAVADKIDASTNLAAMDWEDFEHLIRELFEKEFQTAGGEVKVTQASRDGGVDAIAFDPDPIRGGKIVIQAKRYTNTVGVSAVRDLYGTVMNEGATKGILVSTADYGPDAYEFAKGKPLTLLSGSNLLHLLEKHGHHARIDLREAKRILAEENE